jgi:hypothetical protein
MVRRPNERLDRGGNEDSLTTEIGEKFDDALNGLSSVLSKPFFRELQKPDVVWLDPEYRSGA